ncbi:DNA cytosine methyltransferase [Streptomyces sp. NPDC048417]|uniref:DNA cytosine methyltransferase n=1 Tax=Streptomyces sp. NPDC048417 TaxID=3155387 RepID=UPI003431F3B1
MEVYTKSFTNEPPGPDLKWDPSLGDDGLIRTTVDQTAIRQGFPKDWLFAGGKTARYRQVGNAAPPAVGEALGRAVVAALQEPSPSNAGYTSSP